MGNLAVARKHFAVIGHPVGHSMSDFIHTQLFELSGLDADYVRLDVSPDALKAEYERTLSALDGFNVTIPHKQSIIPMLSSLDGCAAAFGAVNCVKREEDGAHTGFNTDGCGFTSALEAAGMRLDGSVLVLGCGGAARTVAAEAVKAGGRVTVASRSEKGAALAAELGHGAKAVALTDVRGGYDLVVNATPVGMWPNTDASPLKKDQLEGCKALFDLIYNPEETLIMRYAREHGIPAEGGMSMLVRQAVRSHEIWYSAQFDEADIARLIADSHAEMVRRFIREQGDGSIVLFGFMGCGKTTVGKLLAKNLGFGFIDTDEETQRRLGLTTGEIFDRFGEAYFRDEEHKSCIEAAARRRTVIAVGGGAMTFERNAECFEREGVKRVFMNAPLEAIAERLKNDRTRPLYGPQAEKLYNDRLPLYKKAADIEINAVGEPAAVAERIKSKL